MSANPSLFCRSYFESFTKWDLTSETTGNLRVYDYTNGVTRLTITPTGNVAIGTTSPTYTLSVLGTTQNVLSAKFLLSHSIVDIESGAGYNSYLRFMNNGVNKWDLASETTGGLRIYDYANSLTRLLITPIGNVLVGKTSQVNTNYKLDVNGSIRSNEVVVNTTGADFVFNGNYKLRDLKEVEKFIQKNKHLPDIESAKDMEEKGLELGKMDMKLLQKIEELTLYMIDFKKEMDKMKGENQKLKEEIIEIKKK